MPVSIKKEIIRIFTEHPKSIGETYFQHLRFASANGLRLVYSGLACIVHSVLPFLFIDTASDVVKKMYAHMIQRKEEGDCKEPLS